MELYLSPYLPGISLPVRVKWHDSDIEDKFEFLFDLALCKKGWFNTNRGVTRTYINDKNIATRSYMFPSCLDCHFCGMN